MHNIPRAEGSPGNPWLELFQVIFLCNSGLTVDYFQDFALHNSTGKPTASFWISEKDQSVVLEQVIEAWIKEALTSSQKYLTFCISH